LEKTKSIGEIKSGGFGDLIDIHGFTKSGTYRSLTYQKNGETKMYLTGHLEFHIDRCDKKWVRKNDDYQSETMEENEIEILKDAIRELAELGKRLTAYAFHEGELKEKDLKDLIFIGAAVISDPIRPEVENAIKALEDAGVQTKMITGDIRETAVHVADQVGLKTDPMFIGNELENKTDRKLEKIVLESNIIARATPEQKLRFVKALQRQNRIVGVRGDGINDAPALRASHIGIAKGERGTDVARESADLVLIDDSFARLPDGVSIGRKAYDNFRKGSTYYLSAKAILLLIFIIPLILGKEFPFHRSRSF
jgi:Ca2+-transporting ATPase